MSAIPLILNPAAGGGRCAARAEQALRRFADAGLDVAVHATSGPGHATALARHFQSEGHRRLLCAGGDGTTFEVVNGLFPAASTKVPELGVLPLGTGNSFLRDLGLPDAEAAVAAIVRGGTRDVDVVAAHHDAGVLHYINLLSLGFTSAVGTTTNRWFKALGASGYTVATVLEVLRLRSQAFPHRIDDGPLDTAPYVFLSFSNSRCTGGDMQMAPDADVSDGRLDVIRVGPLGRLDLLATFPKIYAGTHLHHPLNSSTTARSVTFDPVVPRDAMIDGEVIRLSLRRLEVLPGALACCA